MQNNSTQASTSFGRWAIVAGLVLVVFFASYRFASARFAELRVGGAGAATAQVAYNDTGVPSESDPTGPGAACACCGGGGPSEPIEGSAAVEGDVQRISVDVSQGYYDPNTIKLVADIPAEITFSQSSGCTGEVLSKDLGFYEDLNSGSKTINLPALTAGTYSFSCGMEMVFGTIVVE
ncbi:MAG: cupredoxin domain-containing protein [Actinomycetota bacterium]|nr:cupredoxin domain-containing protein [Actinomycetota bacterium]